MNPTTEPYRFSASQAVAEIKSGRLSVEQYAKSLLSRFEERDATVHAWAYLNPDLVLQEAKKLDAIPPAERGPLHGVAIGVKDVILTKDMPTQYNSPIYTDDHPQLDAGSIMILRKNGALIYGKTCTTEFAATVVGPKSRNPHDATRTPGGSSSGSGAAVGDMQVPIGLGTQTVGSTIRPGSFNGIYAMKPTWNSISREGQKLYSLIFDTLGLYSRSVEDLQLLADVFKLEDDEPGEHFVVKGAKFAVLKFKTPNWSEAGQGTKDALDLGVKLLKDQGAEVEELVLPDEFDHLTLWHKQVLTGDGRVAFLSDYYTTKEHLHESLVGHVENSDGYSRKEQLVAFDGLAALRPKMDEILGKYAAIIAPSALDEAPVGTNTGNATFCGIWTALHQPVVNIPGFKGVNGMPIGLSVIAPRYRDQHLLRVCKEVGKIFETEGGWTRSL